MIERDLKPGWRRVRFGDVVRLSKARSQDPLADGIERYVGLEHLEPGDLRIRRWGSVAEGVTFDGSGWFIFFVDLYHPRRSRLTPDDCMVEGVYTKLRL